GGVLGVGAGLGRCIVLLDSFGWRTVLGAGAVGLAFAFAPSGGTVFGVKPSLRASAIEPGEAVRYERTNLGIEADRPRVFSVPGLDLCAAAACALRRASTSRVCRARSRRFASVAWD